MKSKKAALVDKEIIELALGAAAVFVLAILLYGLIAPNFDKVDKSAEGYFDAFVEEVGVVKNGGVGRFSIWQLEEKSDVKFYLVYFGEGVSYENKFYSFGDNNNHVCVCYDDEETKCNYCMDLEKPALMDGRAKWGVGVGEKLSIEDKGEFYEVVLE
jgi:hypothetical protein